MATTTASRSKFSQPGWLGDMIIAGVRRLIVRAKRSRGKRLPTPDQMEALRRKFAKE